MDTAITTMMGHASTVLGAIVEDPNLALFLAASVIGVAVSITRKLIHTR